MLAELTREGAPQPEYTTVIVPDIWGGTKKTRYLPNGVDPNRTFPAVGTADTSSDSLQREMPAAVSKLVELREAYKPTRIVQLHGIVVPKDKKLAATKVGKPGVTTDVRRDKDERMIDETGDLALAKSIALESAAGMRKAGLDPAERMSGNALGSAQETFVYPTDKAPSQPGVTGGMYFSHATAQAPAANVVLIETYNNESSRSGKDQMRAAELQAHANAIVKVFLGR